MAAVAVRDDKTGRIWQGTGVLHADLIGRAQRELDSYMDVDRFESGYLTSTGRFVDRVEAEQVAKTADQVRDDARFQGELDAADLTSEEQGADKKPQLVLPGAEKISQAEQAKRKAAQPLKPKAEQKPMDVGMFGDESKQLDLVDETRKKPRGPALAQALTRRAPGLYSAVLRAVEGAKISKAPAVQ